MNEHDSYVEQMIKSSDEMCAHLHLIDVEEEGALGRYYVKPSLGHGYSWVEIVVLRGGSLLVHGDCDTVVFSSYHKPKHPRQVVEWIAKCGWDYATQKASIGSSIARVWHRDVVVESVCHWRRSRLVTSEHARDLVETSGDSGLFFAKLHSFGYYELTYEHFGMVTAPRVFAAQAVLRKLSNLLGDTP